MSLKENIKAPDFKLPSTDKTIFELNKIKNDFSSVKITDKETLFIIKNFKDNLHLYQKLEKSIIHNDINDNNIIVSNDFFRYSFS